MFEEELKNRITKYLEASGARISFICSKLHLTPSALFQWRKGQLNLTPERLLSIDDYLKRWGY